MTEELSSREYQQNLEMAAWNSQARESRAAEEKPVGSGIQEAQCLAEK
jgi:hypothetical protein